MKNLTQGISVLTFLLLMFCYPNHTFGQQLKAEHVVNSQGKLSFFLSDSENGYGVQGKLIFRSSRESFELSTDESGNIEYLGMPGRYDITILAKGYDVLNTYFIVEDGKTVNIHTILEKTNRIPVLSQVYAEPIVEGYVIDPETGKPLPGVNVELIQEKLKTTTDSKGYFKLKPSNFTSIHTPEDQVTRSDFKFSKDGFKVHVVESLLMVPDKIKLKIYLEQGSGENTEKYHQNVLDGTDEDVELYEENVPQEEGTDSNAIPAKSTCSIPNSIRVGTNCSCTNCSNVSVMSLQLYTESGLDDEWISSWGIESLKAGSIPYRTYGGYYVNNPVKPNFDIASSTCNQVWGATVYSNAQSAAQATNGIILTANGINPARSEYSAENNYGGTSYNCSNGKAGGSGAYACHSDNICSGKTPAGHGRGMCQWGSQRWATNSGKSYTWIINHYFVTTVGYSLCGGTPPPPPAATNLNVSQKPDCTKGAIFSWTNSASNWSIQVSTSSNFSNVSSKTIASGTSTTAPTGFSPAIDWQHNTTYY